MAFFNSAITVLQTLVVALGAGLGIWGAINLLEGYGNDNPGAEAEGRICGERLSVYDRLPHQPAVHHPGQRGEGPADEAGAV